MSTWGYPAALLGGLATHAPPAGFVVAIQAGVPWLLNDWYATPGLAAALVVGQAVPGWARVVGDVGLRKGLLCQLSDKN